MPAARVGLAALAVLGLFIAWRELEQRFGRTGRPPFRGSLVALAAESLLLTLFAALWFGSLGSGGVALLFLCVGALIELPVRLRTVRGSELPWMAIAAGMTRIVIAGWVLKLVLR